MPNGNYREHTSSFGENMATGSVYIWERSDSDFTGGRVYLSQVELPHLRRDGAKPAGLRGRYVDVICDGFPSELSVADGEGQTAKVGEALPDERGDYIFNPFGGGIFGEQAGYESAWRFGQVNVYYHVSLMAQRMNEALRLLGEGPLPKVRAIVNAHLPKALGAGGKRQKDSGGWVPVKGTRYRYPARTEDIDRFSTAGCGELLFGRGRSITTKGWLPRISGGAYLCDPSHDAGFIYQAFAFHVLRHTADIGADRLRMPRAGFSRPCALELGLSMYLAASMLATPYLRCWHRRHDAEFIAPDTLANDFRLDGTDEPPSEALVAQVLAGALWDLHEAFSGDELACVSLVIVALLALGRLSDSPYAPSRANSLEDRNNSHPVPTCPV